MTGRSARRLKRTEPSCLLAIKPRIDSSQGRLKVLMISRQMISEGIMHIFKVSIFRRIWSYLSKIEKIAKEKQITPSQLALSWIIVKGHLPITGTKGIKYVEQNIAATDIELSEEDLNRLEKNHNIRNRYR